jgi:hypothetical protein
MGHPPNNISTLAPHVPPRASPKPYLQNSLTSPPQFIRLFSVLAGYEKKFATVCGTGSSDDLFFVLL